MIEKTTNGYIGIERKEFEKQIRLQKADSVLADGWKHWRAQETRVEARGGYRNAIRREKWKDIWCSRLMKLFEMEDEDDSIIYKVQEKIRIGGKKLGWRMRKLLKYKYIGIWKKFERREKREEEK